MRPLTTAEVTACIYHYMDMCPVVAQRMPLIGFIHFAMEELPSSNRILSPTLGYKQANKLVNRVSITSSTEIFWCCPCPLPKVSVTMHPRDAETHSGKHQSGSNESVSTFPKACRFAYLPQQQRPQHAESLETLGTCFSSPSQCYRHSTTSLCEPHLQHQPPRAVSWLGRTHPNPASYFLSPS